MKEMSTMEKKKGGMGSLMTRANMEITGSKGMTSVTTSTSTSTSTSEDGPVAGPSPGPGPSLRSESCSSSIGQPDDDTDDDEEEEVQSTLSSLASLEDSLPFKKGLSKFYGGKSKSYGNLGEVRSLEDLGKSDNPFNKRRRTLMAYNLMFKDNHHISNASTSHKHHKSIGIGSTTTMSHNNGKAALFYAHSNHISMPLLPLAEDHDDNDNDDHYNDNGVDDDYCVAPTPTSFLPPPPPPPVIATTPAATPTPTPTSSHHSISNSNSHTSLDIYAPLNL